MDKFRVTSDDLKLLDEFIKESLNKTDEVFSADSMGKPVMKNYTVVEKWANKVFEDASIDQYLDKELSRIEALLDTDKEISAKDYKIIQIAKKVTQGGQPLSAEEVGILLGISRQMSNRIERQAKDKMQKRIKADPEKYSALQKGTKLQEVNEGTGGWIKHKKPSTVGTVKQMGTDIKNQPLKVFNTADQDSAGKFLKALKSIEEKLGNNIEEARTIGVYGKRLVIRLVKQAIAEKIPSHKIYDFVVENLPEKITDSWEDALGEIDRLVSDVIAGDSIANKNIEETGTVDFDSAATVGANPGMKPTNLLNLREYVKVNEVAPPGYEKVVKGLKKNPDIDNPWAVAWSMYKKGIKPKNEGYPPAMQVNPEDLKEDEAVEEVDGSQALEENEKVQVLADVDMGGGAVADLFYNKTFHEFIEVKTLANGKVITLNIPEEDFEPELYGPDAAEKINSVSLVDLKERWNYETNSYEAPKRKAPKYTIGQIDIGDLVMLPDGTEVAIDDIDTADGTIWASTKDGDSEDYNIEDITKIVYKANKKEIVERKAKLKAGLAKLKKEGYPPAFQPDEKTNNVVEKVKDLFEGFGGRPKYSKEETPTITARVAQLGKTIRPEIKAIIDASPQVKQNRNHPSSDQDFQMWIYNGLFPAIAKETGITKDEISKEEQEYATKLFWLNNEFTNYAGD